MTEALLVELPDALVATIAARAAELVEARRGLLTHPSRYLTVPEGQLRP
jgi:hypothetical protein